MAIVISSNFVPIPGSPLYVTEDKYIRGGLRIVANSGERDATPPFHKKVGMVCILQDTGEWFQLQADLTTWNPVELGGEDLNLSVVSPLQLSNDTLSIDTRRILPAGGTTGHFLSKTDTGSQWQEMIPGSLARQSTSRTFSTINSGEKSDAVLPLGKSVFLLKVSVDIPCKVEGFSTFSYDDKNPYTFIAEEGHLSDQGLSRTLTGEYYHQRRYSIVANLEEPATSAIYWRITNMGVSTIRPTLSITYVPFE